MNILGTRVDRTLLVPLMAGVVGGGLMTGAIAVVAERGGPGSLTKGVTVRQTMVVPSTAAEGTRVYTAHQVYAMDAPGVVSVSATGVGQTPSPAELVKGEGGEEGTSSGSGFEIDGSGTILTNWHVVENAAKVMVSVSEDRRAVRARVVGEDPARDLALLRIPTEGLTLRPLKLGRSSGVQVGEPVLAIGNPFGYTRTLTTGVVSALGRQIQAPNGATTTTSYRPTPHWTPAAPVGRCSIRRGKSSGSTRKSSAWAVAAATSESALRSRSTRREARLRGWRSSELASSGSRRA